MNINGYTLKSVKNFMGREGYGFSANLYHNGKRIGEVTDTANGSGEIDIYLDMDCRDQHKNVDTDFLERLYLLHGQEKSFKAKTKSGLDKALICVAFSEPTTDWNYYLEYTGSKSMTEDVFITWYNKNGVGGTIEKIDIFTSLDDFNIQDTAESENLSPQEDGMTMS